MIALPPPVPAPAPTPVRASALRVSYAKGGIGRKRSVGSIVNAAKERDRGAQDSMTPVLRTPVDPMPAPTRKPMEKR